MTDAAIDRAAVRRDLAAQSIETPSWAFGNSGTRFKVFAAGRARRATRTRRSPTPRRCTGSPARRRPSRCTSRGTGSTTTPPSAAHAEDHGVALGTINSNTFQDDDYKLGSAHPPRPAVRAARRSTTTSRASTSWTQTGSRDLKIWLADGTNYPGQDDIRARQDRLAESLREDLRSGSATTSACVLEYKFFEPAFYHTDVPDWGTSLRPVPAPSATRRTVVPRHRPPRARHEHRVHRRAAAAAREARLVRLQLPLLRRRRPDRRRRRPVPAVPHPVRGRPRRRLRPGRRRRVHARPVPQHRGEDPRPDPLGAERAGDDGQGAAASTPTRSRAAQAAGDVLGANARPHGRLQHRRAPAARRAARETRGLPADPMARLRGDPGYQEKIEAERVGGTQAGWGA